MRLVSFGLGGVARFGAMTAGGLVDLTAHFAGRASGLREMLAAGLVGEAREAADQAQMFIDEQDVTWLPVIPDPDKIVMAAVNYVDHRAETGREPTKYPMLFLRLARSQIGHRQALVVPKASAKLDYEGEIAVVIGKAGRHIARENAMAHVAGYAAYNDGSVRDWQRHTAQFTPGKNFDATGAFGPWLVTADEIADYRAMTLTTRLNGDIMQSAVASDLIFDIEALIAYTSTWTTLVPGDVIVTGTCGGVGFARTPPVYLKPGDVVEVDVGQVGTLTNPVNGE